MSMQVVLKPKDEPRELSVSEITRAIKAQVEGAAHLRDVWIRGEISNIRLAATGHLYFTLKDDSCQLKVAFFNYGRGPRRAPEEGKAILVHGDVRVYEARGEYQLVADDLIKVGDGDLAAKFEALKRRLAEEGLFDESRKKPLPAVPERIGVITSLSTAALRDVLNVLSRRAPYAHVVVFPAAVQGDSAAAEIVRALCSADGYAGLDVLLLVRGGGSIEDLWCFNDESLARALADCRVPVISGVGHEIDFTIVDFVADLRAPTPSAAAELAAPDVLDLAGGVAYMTRRMGERLGRRLEQDRSALERLFDRRLLRDVAWAVESRAQRLDGAGEALVRAAVARTHGAGPRAEAREHWYARPVQRMGAAIDRVRALTERRLVRGTDALLRGFRDRFELSKRQLDAAALKVRALDPAAPLEAGFALVWDGEGRLLRDAEQVSSGAWVRVQLSRGEFEAVRSDP
jgi:exodeoxyribonuclease VII large subunit